MDTIVPSSNLQVTRTAIKSRTSLNSGRIHPLTSELPAHEGQKKCCGHDSAFIFDQIFSNLQVTRTGIKSQTSLISGQIGLFTLKLLALDPENFWRKCCGHNSTLIFDRIIIKLASNEDSHKISDKFEFFRIHSLTSELPTLKGQKKCYGHNSAFSFDRIVFKLADNEDRHKILDKFHFRPDRFRVTCLEHRKVFP